MRFMIVVKATKDSEAGVMPEEPLFAAMATHHEELVKAGVLLDASGLKPTSQGWRIRYSGGKRTVIEGPFTEAKEVVGAFFIIEAADMSEAIRVASLHPAAKYGEHLGFGIEVRPIEMFDQISS